MNNGPLAKVFLGAALVAAILLLSGCSDSMADLHSYIDEIKARPGGRIEALPQIKPYQTYVYEDKGRRSPFVPLRPASAGVQQQGPQPIANRNKEYLEQFPLDSLSMVGTLKKDGKIYGLIQTKDTLVHRVLPGNYIGQNDGRIVAITESEISVEELVPDGIGGFFDRSAAIGLSN